MDDEEEQAGGVEGAFARRGGRRRRSRRRCTRHAPPRSRQQRTRIGAHAQRVAPERAARLRPAYVLCWARVAQGFWLMLACFAIARELGGRNHPRARVCRAAPRAMNGCYHDTAFVTPAGRRAPLQRLVRASEHRARGCGVFANLVVPGARPGAAANRGRSSLIDRLPLCLRSQVAVCAREKTGQAHSDTQHVKRPRSTCFSKRALGTLAQHTHTHIAVVTTHTRNSTERAALVGGRWLARQPRRGD